MKIFVCAKEVLDPDAVNNYALAGRLEIGEDEKTLTQSTIPALMNAYDEQALEVALRLRDAGAECTIHVVSVGEDRTALLRHAASIGADDVTQITPPTASPDCHATASLLAAHIKAQDGADLVLCGRQASDDDQGVVPGLLAEALGMPLVNVARAIEARAGTLCVTRVTPDGDESVEVEGAAVVTLSNEVGEPRYPTAANKLKSRRVKPTLIEAGALGLANEALSGRVRVVRQFVPEIQQDCEFISGDTPRELAAGLMKKLREDRLVS